jgi:hypothetical protein
MRHRSIAAVCATAVVLIAGAALAADGWSTYRNADFGLSIDTPTPPQTQVTSTASPGGPIPTLVGNVAISQDAVLVFTSGDYHSLPAPPDVDAVLEAGVQGGVSASGATLDSEVKIDVEGIPGRDITMHGQGFVARSRILFKNRRIYAAIGVGSVAAGVPAEYDRFMRSMKLD